MGKENPQQVVWSAGCEMPVVFMEKLLLFRPSLLVVMSAGPIIKPCDCRDIGCEGNGASHTQLLRHLVKREALPSPPFLQGRGQGAAQGDATRPWSAAPFAGPCSACRRRCCRPHVLLSPRVALCYRYPFSVAWTFALPMGLRSKRVGDLAWPKGAGEKPVLQRGNTLISGMASGQGVIPSIGRIIQVGILSLRAAWGVRFSLLSSPRSSLSLWSPRLIPFWTRTG